MNEIFQFDIENVEQSDTASPSDSLPSEIEDAVARGVIKGYEQINKGFSSSSDAGSIQYYTVATPSSAEGQTVSLLADLRNITLIGFILLFAIIVFYHLKGTIISYLS